MLRSDRPLDREGVSLSEAGRGGCRLLRGRPGTSGRCNRFPMTLQVDFEAFGLVERDDESRTGRSRNKLAVERRIEPEEVLDGNACKLGRNFQFEVMADGDYVEHALIRDLRQLQPESRRIC